MKNKKKDTNKKVHYPKYLYVRYYDNGVLRLEKVWRRNGEHVYCMDFGFEAFEYTDPTSDHVNLSRKENENVINILHQNSVNGAEALFDSGNSFIVYLTPNAAFGEM